MNCKGLLEFSVAWLKLIIIGVNFVREVEEELIAIIRNITLKDEGI